MKKFLIIAICIIASIQYTFSVNIDTLNPEIKSSLKSKSWDKLKPEKRISLCIKLFTDSINVNPEKSKIFANLALQKSKEINKKGLEGELYANIGEAYEEISEYDLSLKNYERAIYIFRSIKDSKNYANSLISIGSIYSAMNEFDKALLYYNKAQKIHQSIKYEKGSANAISNAGSIYQSRGDYKLALKCYFAALEKRKNIKDSMGMSNSYNYLGNLYYDLNNKDTALVYYYHSLEIKNIIHDSIGIDDPLENIGNIYNEWGNTNNEKKYFDQALYYHLRALSKRKLIMDREGIAGSLSNIGNTYYYLGDYSKALEYNLKSLKIEREIDNKEGITISLSNIGDIYNKLKKYRLSEKYLNESLELAKKYNFNMMVKENYKLQALNYSALGEYKKAYESSQNFILIKDSIFSEESTKAISELETKNKIDDDNRKKAEIEKINKEKTRQVNNLQYSGIFVLVAVMFISIFVVGKFNISFNFVNGLIFISFLLLFESISVFLDQSVNVNIGSSPVIKLGFNLVLAVMLSPVHSIFENKVKGKMMKI